MRKFFINLLFIFPTIIFAQHDSINSIPKTQGLISDSMYLAKLHSYFSQYNLNPDSARSVVLFQQVYEWKGTPYRRAGHSKSGIDCSGFVERMYSDAYQITLFGSALGLYNQCYELRKEDLQEGDLLFFKIKKGQISHVAIYLGNNKFAHATVHGGVMINDLDEAYYKKYFFTGGRIKTEI